MKIAKCFHDTHIPFCSNQIVSKKARGKNIKNTQTIFQQKIDLTESFFIPQN